MMMAVLFCLFAFQLLLRICQSQESVHREVVSTNLFDASCAVGGDIDGDSRPEIISASADGIHVFSRASPATKHYNNTWSSRQIWTTTDESPSRVIVHDMNGDGRLDVVVSGLRLDSIFWLENGNGLTWESHQVPTSRKGVFDIAVADINGDLRPDIIEANFFDDSIAVHYQEADEDTWTIELVHQNHPVSQAVALCIADIDADSLLDIAAVGRDAYASWFANGNHWETHLLGFNTNGYDAIACVEMGNNRTDLVLGTTADDTIDWLQNDGSIDAWTTIPVTSEAAAVHRILAVSAGLVFAANFRSGEIMLYALDSSGESFYPVSLDDDVPEATFVAFSDIDNKDGIDLIYTGTAVGWLDLPYIITATNTTNNWLSITIQPTPTPTTAAPTLPPTIRPTISPAPSAEPTVTPQEDDNNDKPFNVLWLVFVGFILFSLLCCYCTLRCLYRKFILPSLYRHYHIVAPKIQLFARRFPLIHRICCCTCCTCCPCSSEFFDDDELAKVIAASEDPLHPRDGVLLQGRAPVIQVHGSTVQKNKLRFVRTGKRELSVI